MECVLFSAYSLIKMFCHYGASWLGNNLTCKTFIQCCRVYNKGSASCIIIVLHWGAGPLPGLQNAYPHFHIDDSLMHIFNMFCWLNCIVFYYTVLLYLW